MTRREFSFLLVALTAPGPLAAERWKTRPLIIVAPQMPGEFLQPAARAALAERQVVLFTIINGIGHRDEEPLDAAATAALLKQFGLTAAGPATMLLIGKDGGVKLRQAHLSVAEILATIDRMPMRRTEMKGSV